MADQGTRLQSIGTVASQVFGGSQGHAGQQQVDAGSVDLITADRDGAAIGFKDVFDIGAATIVHTRIFIVRSGVLAPVNRRVGANGPLAAIGADSYSLSDRLGDIVALVDRYPGSHQAVRCITITINAEVITQLFDDSVAAVVGRFGLVEDDLFIAVDGLVFRHLSKGGCFGILPFEGYPADVAMMATVSDFELVGDTETGTFISLLLDLVDLDIHFSIVHVLDLLHDFFNCWYLVDTGKTIDTFGAFHFPGITLGPLEGDLTPGKVPAFVSHFEFLDDDELATIVFPLIDILTDVGYLHRASAIISVALFN